MMIIHECAECDTPLISGSIGPECPSCHWIPPYGTVVPDDPTGVNLANGFDDSHGALMLLNEELQKLPGANVTQPPLEFLQFADAMDREGPAALSKLGTVLDAIFPSAKGAFRKTGDILTTAQQTLAMRPYELMLICPICPGDTRFNQFEPALRATKFFNCPSCFSRFSVDVKAVKGDNARLDRQKPPGAWRLYPKDVLVPHVLCKSCGKGFRAAASSFTRGKVSLTCRYCPTRLTFMVDSMPAFGMTDEAEAASPDASGAAYWDRENAPLPVAIEKPPAPRSPIAHIQDRVDRLKQLETYAEQAKTDLQLKGQSLADFDRLIDRERRKILGTAHDD